MIADDCAPSHAESLAQCLTYARDYAEELRLMLAGRDVDSDRASRLVQAMREMLCVAENELAALDDTQEVTDAIADIRGLSDAELYRAITDAPPPN
ncbi:hypothetical protein [Streptomyces sp. NPDC006134]|uniref:hypothetical protein n=1 Tax=Streptomyces sp. NPDC006134 TaxID=3154467 RepID=UPI0033E3AFC3